MQYSAAGFTGWLRRRCSEVTEQSLVGVWVCARLCVSVCIGHEAQDKQPKIDLTSTLLTREDSFDNKSTSLWMNERWSAHARTQTRQVKHVGDELVQKMNIILISIC